MISYDEAKPSFIQFNDLGPFTLTPDNAEGETPDGFSESDSEKFVHEFLMTTEGIELAEAYPRIKSAKHRRKILDLVRPLAEDSFETTR